MRSRPAAHTEPVIPVRHRVWLRLIVVTSLLLVLAVYGTSAFVIRLATLDRRADASDRNYQLAMRAAQQIDSLVENATVDVSELANVVNLADLQPKPSADVVLESFVLSANDFAKLVIVGADGRVIADSVPGTVQISDLDPEAVLHARAGEPFTSTPVIDAGIPLVTLVVPLSRRTVHPASLVADSASLKSRPSWRMWLRKVEVMPSWWPRTEASWREPLKISRAPWPPRATV